MCGISGVANPRGGIEPSKLDRMRDTLARRGPDGAGSWISGNGQVGLSHRRLSILDLSAAGAQPMHSASGRYSISFNGEIYNFANLRKELEAAGMRFVSHSDTEILLGACERWGVIETLPRLAGMFAFAIWDAQESTLYLARDRVGIKPFYYCYHDGELSFASELRPLVNWRGNLPPISKRGLNEYLRLGYVPCPLSIFEGIWKLPPGTYMTWRTGQLSKPQAFWTYMDAVASGQAHAFVDECSAIAELERVLQISVARHMVSDVPLGAFLSGGIDSSTVVALMQAQSSRPIKTFSIGFSDTAYDEAQHAARVATHLGTDHTELYVTDADARAVIPYLADIYDEPFADVSQIPTILVSQLARSQVTVALSGDGGDELFAGYNRYVFVSAFWRNLQRMPLGLRCMAAACLRYPSVARWDALFKVAGPLLPKSLQPSLPGQKMHKVGAILPAASLLALHSHLVSQWATPQVVLNAEWRGGDALWQDLLREEPTLTPPMQQAVWDAQTYMVDDILAKVDRASMRFGLEARVPLLDHTVVETAWRVPDAMKLRDGQGKWLLKQLLYRYVPQSLVDRPKMGFGVPIDAWLRDGVRDWAEPYLDESRLRSEGYLDADVIRQTWSQHQKGAIESGGPLWTVLMFQQWLERCKGWL
ncbi:asparagine synthase (glutamine-hydrolyzing) [Laribacter hongkongensis]|uniref:asparagine synthase (glutamine-hydrolyzing) n=1 Tax=Laribacter hongkongensis TaxID=168471 RepID=UPI0023D9234D|nr:asparagine synthase (glutamine-hydrolyzing) [Laribacter hongkongensis]MCG9095342.1 asparagine synthase (glutamine-hydrolyzing) [Laribacter hongkongensis]